MKNAVAFLSFVGMVVASTAAFAGADDAKWVAQCLKDNTDAKVSVEIVAKYCACMNGKMDENETQSITQWEKTHATERKACEAASGWQ